MSDDDNVIPVFTDHDDHSDAADVARLFNRYYPTPDGVHVKKVQVNCWVALDDLGNTMVLPTFEDREFVIKVARAIRQEHLAQARMWSESIRKAEALADEAFEIDGGIGERAADDFFYEWSAGADDDKD